MYGKCSPSSEPSIVGLRERERERLGSSCMANVAHVASLLWLDSISFVNLRNVCPERKKNFVLILLGIIKINVVHMLSIERHNKNIYIYWTVAKMT
jgi:hypothetical protein